MEHVSAKWMPPVIKNMIVMMEVMSLTVLALASNVTVDTVSMSLDAVTESSSAVMALMRTTVLCQDVMPHSSLVTGMETALTRARCVTGRLTAGMEVMKAIVVGEATSAGQKAFSAMMEHALVFTSAVTMSMIVCMERMRRAVQLVVVSTTGCAGVESASARRVFVMGRSSVLMEVMSGNSVTATNKEWVSVTSLENVYKVLKSVMAPKIAKMERMKTIVRGQVQKFLTQQQWMTKVHLINKNLEAPRVTNILK